MSITGTEIKKEVVIKDNKGNVIATLPEASFPLNVEINGQFRNIIRISKWGKVVMA